MSGVPPVLPDDPRGGERGPRGPWAGEVPPPWDPSTWGPEGRGRAPWARRHRRGAGPSAFGCFLVAIILFIALITATATWVAGWLLGLLAPGAAPSAVTAVTVVIVLVVALLAGIRVFATTLRPLAQLSRAAERLADGETGVRIDARGPRPVRGLVATFNAMAERLDRTRADRQALLADVTHELRTPLAVVSGGLEAMLDGIHPMDEDHVAPLLAQTAVMDRLLDDLRTLSLAQAGALPLHREPVDLRALADELVAANRSGAEAAGVTLASSGDATLTASVDPVRVREILGNLVGNALRHTPAGGRITVDVRGADGDGVLTVSDTGDGIAPGDLPRVFDRFHRRADSGGSGLGLAIVRDLVAAHGGTVGVTSDGVAGSGATFVVRLPLRD